MLYLHALAKADVSQFNLPRGTENLKKKQNNNEEKLKTKKICSEETVLSRVRGVNLKGGKEEKSLWWEGFVRQVRLRIITP